MDFIFMLTRQDRTVEDAADLVDAVCDMGVSHVGFEDVGASEAAMRRIVASVTRRAARRTSMSPDGR